MGCHSLYVRIWYEGAIYGGHADSLCQWPNFMHVVRKERLWSRQLLILLLLLLQQYAAMCHPSLLFTPRLTLLWCGYGCRYGSFHHHKKIIKISACSFALTWSKTTVSRATELREIHSGLEERLWSWKNLNYHSFHPKEVNKEKQTHHSDEYIQGDWTGRSIVLWNFLYSYLLYVLLNWSNVACCHIIINGRDNSLIHSFLH